jgi:acyl-CoA synthetase (AMP-forming)/AMP-acid ligase II
MRVAHGAIAQTGLALEKDDIVGVILPNVPEFPAIVFGITEASRIVTFVNPLFTVDEVCRQFENANVKCIFTVPSMLATAQAYQKRTSGYKGTVVVGGKNDLPNRVLSFEVSFFSEFYDFLKNLGSSRLSTQITPPRCQKWTPTKSPFCRTLREPLAYRRA